MNKTLVVVALAAALAGGAAQAACLSDEQVADLAAAIEARTPAATPEGLSEADASCSRAKLQARLAAKYGATLGYKAGLTNPAVQKRFNYDQPVWGVLYQGMVLPDGAVVDPAFGARPLFESDLLVRVKSADINNAKTPAEVLANIDQIIPFIELPDLVVQAPPRLNGPGVAAINVGARLGVRGVAIAVPQADADRAAMLDALRDMTVRVTDGRDNTELARGKGSDILEHPLNAVVWLAGALATEGLAMKPGELISLGSFSPLMPPKPGQSVVVFYDGLPRAQPVVVTFAPQKAQPTQSVSLAEPAAGVASRPAAAARAAGVAGAAAAPSASTALAVASPASASTPVVAAAGTSSATAADASSAVVTRAVPDAQRPTVTDLPVAK